jgi:hypothetical protein
MTAKPTLLARPFRLTAVHCERHPRRKVTVIVFPHDDSKPLRCFCSVECARPEGWPFLTKQATQRQRSRA